MDKIKIIEILKTDIISEGAYNQYVMVKSNSRLSITDLVITNKGDEFLILEVFTPKIEDNCILMLLNIEPNTQLIKGDILHIDDSYL